MVIDIGVFINFCFYYKGFGGVRWGERWGKGRGKWWWEIYICLLELIYFLNNFNFFCNFKCLIYEC